MSGSLQKKKIKVKRFIYHSKKEIREQFLRKMNQDVNGNRKLLGKLKNRKAAGKDEVKGEMIKGGGDRVVDWIWRLCNMAFEIGVLSKDWRYTVIILLYKGKGERTEYNSYRGLLNLLSVVRKIYA